MIAQDDDLQVFEWLVNAAAGGGGFVSSFAIAALRADDENYPIIRPALIVLRKKYPVYEQSEFMKQEIPRKPEPTL
jgi:hypothetical protein